MTPPSPREALIDALCVGGFRISKAKRVVDALDAYLDEWIKEIYRAHGTLADARDSASHEAAAVAAIEEREAELCPRCGRGSIHDFPDGCPVCGRGYVAAPEPTVPREPREFMQWRERAPERRNGDRRHYECKPDDPSPHPPSPSEEPGDASGMPPGLKIIHRWRTR